MNELLKALANADRELEASPAVEARLRSAFQKKHQRRWWPYCALAGAAAVILMIALRVPKAETMEIAVATPKVAVVPVPKAAIQVARRVPRPSEAVTEFYPLIDDPLPFDRGELLRVSVPASAMRIAGVAVSEERVGEMVQADVLVGQEGLARAIRFVGVRSN